MQSWILNIWPAFWLLEMDGEKSQGSSHHQSSLAGGSRLWKILPSSCTNSESRTWLCYQLRHHLPLKRALPTASQCCPSDSNAASDKEATPFWAVLTQEGTWPGSISGTLPEKEKSKSKEDNSVPGTTNHLHFLKNSGACIVKASKVILCSTRREQCQQITHVRQTDLV